MQNFLKFTTLFSPIINLLFKFDQLLTCCCRVKQSCCKPINALQQKFCNGIISCSSQLQSCFGYKKCIVTMSFLMRQRFSLGAKKFQQLWMTFTIQAHYIVTFLIFLFKCHQFCILFCAIKGQKRKSECVCMITYFQNKFSFENINMARTFPVIYRYVACFILLLKVSSFFLCDTKV